MAILTSNKKNINLITVGVSSLIMAIAGMGDALLYIHLPINGQDLGLSALFIGVLLSVNKFIRLGSNRWVAQYANKLGIKPMLFIGALFALIATAIYAYNPNILLWVLARVFWGIAYSALRFSVIQYASHSNKKATALGVSNSIAEIGPIIAYIIDPMLIVSFNHKTIFFGLTCLSLLSLLLFLWLPTISFSDQRLIKWKLRKPSSVEWWLAIIAFVIEGLLVVGISKVINFSNSPINNVMLSAGIFIAARRLFTLAVAPFSGWLSDKWDFLKTFNTAAFTIVLGLFLMLIKFPAVGLILTFLGGAVNNALYPMFAVKYVHPSKNFDTITQLSTAKDIGGAFGALMALFIFMNFKNHYIFLTILGILSMVWYKLNKFVIDYERVI